MNQAEAALRPESLFANLDCMAWAEPYLHIAVNAPPGFLDGLPGALEGSGRDSVLLDFQSRPEDLRHDLATRQGGDDEHLNGLLTKRLASLDFWPPFTPNDPLIEKVFARIGPQIRIGVHAAEAEAREFCLFYNLAPLHVFADRLVAKRQLNVWEQSQRKADQAPSASLPTECYAARRADGKAVFTVANEPISAEAVAVYEGERIWTGVTGRFHANVTLIENAIFHGPTGCVANADGHIVSETTDWVMFYEHDIPGYYCAQETDWLLWRKEDAPGPVVDLPGDAYFAVGTRFPTNYYHFFNDLCPKLWLREKAIAAGFAPAKTPILLGDVPENRFQSDFIAGLGLGPEEIVRAATGFHRAPTLYVPALREANHEIGRRTRNVDFYQWLRMRSQALIDPACAAPPMVYLSRADTHKRKLVNEAEIAAYLESQGFAIVVPSWKSFKEQVALLREAKIVIGPHGAGLYNFAFAPFDATLGEIRIDANPDLSYRYLAQFRGSNFTYLRAMAVEAEGVSSHNCDIHMDLDVLKRFVEETRRKYGL
jgi:capsular polysaccharide biosynthesis protein